jgi:pimeloyl-ACP methyl ester carboxylesterase
VRENFADEILPGITEHTLDLDDVTGDVRLNYAEGPANGPPLLLLHGLGRRWQVFLPIISALSQRWHIFAPDLRGHGKSSRVSRGYHGPQYSADIVHLLRERVCAPAVIFGHSLGGMLAMWLASHHPELVRALILGDNRIIVGSLHHPMYTALFSGLRNLAAQGASVDDIAEGIGKIELPLPGSEGDNPEIITINQLPGNDQAYLSRWARCVQQADPDTYAMVLDGSSIEGWDAETVLRGIACPTLLLQGTTKLGGLMSDADVELAKRLLPHHAHVQFENLGHALFIQQPETVLQAVANFLESL